MLRALLVISILLVAAVVVFLAFFIPIGTGEYFESPDGRFIAHAHHTTFGLWWEAFEPEVRLRIECRDTHAEIWQLTFRPTARETLIDYGDRREKHIVWSADSRSVTVPVTAQERITIPVAE